jgi:uncharacterized membrane protein YedE/YeeE
MTIDWTHFTPWLSLAGGVLLGIGSAIFILFNGRILGISSIVGGLLTPQAGGITWRLVFLAGLFLSPLVFGWFAPAHLITPPRIDAELWGLIGAGLLVGAGTRSASGCTSGHGVCGLSRLSPRSLVATLSFMAAGFITVYLVRHAL